jgi:hypothetical protein
MMLSALVVALMTQQPMQHAHVPAPASAQSQASAPEALSPEEVRSRVNAYLGTIDRPVPAESWRALGADAGRVLEGIFMDHTEPTYRRARAIGALGIVAPARAATLAPAAAENEKEPYLVRLGALTAVRAALPDADFKSVADGLMRGAKDVRVRAQAAAVLVERTHQCEALHAQLSRERAEDREYFHAARRTCP